MRPVLPMTALAETGPEDNTGVLWAINRALFHPRGYALALHYVALCSICGAERTDYEFTGENAHLPACPNCQSEASPHIELEGWSIQGDGKTLWSFPEEMDDEGFRLFELFLDTLPAEEEPDAT